MDFNFLPERIVKGLIYIDTDKIYEIRLRIDMPVKVLYGQKCGYLCYQGITNDFSKSIICSSNDIELIINRVTEFSLYAFNEKIKKGFLTTKDGIRIGLAGECVFNNGNIETIKNFSSLVIRIPHYIKGCSKNIFNKIRDENRVLNTLIISPPGYGKTTLLKDLSKTINDFNMGSVLIIDERNEFSEINGENIDKILYSDKLFAFQYGIRSLCPQIVITDELSGEKDWLFIEKVKRSGISVIASCHGRDFNCISGLAKEQNFFERYVILNDYCVKGQVYEIFDKEFNSI